MNRCALTIVVLVAATACAESDGSLAEPGSPSDPSTVVTTSTSTPTTTTPPPTTALTTDVAADLETFTCEPAPADVTQVVTGPFWQEGDERLLELTKEQNRADSAAGSSVSEVEVSVLSARADGWTFVWSTESSLLDGVGPEIAQGQELVDQLPKERLRYTVDDLGFITSVENTDEIRDNLLGVITLLSDIAGAESAESEGLNAVARLYTEMSDADLAQLATERVQLYHGLEAYSLTLGMPLTYDDILPNALGGEPFPAISTVELTDVIDEDGCVAMSLIVQPDPAEFGRILAETVADAFGDSGSLDEAGAFDDAVIENLIVGQFDYSSGRLWKVTATQTISIEQVHAVETTMIRDVTPVDE